MRALGLLVVVVTLVMGGLGWLDRRAAGRRNPMMVLDGRRLGCVVAGFATAWAGACLVLGWSMVHLAPAHQSRNTPDQPAPSWLWQVGAPMAVVGAVVVTAACFTAPAATADRHTPWEAGWNRRLVLGLLLVTDVPLILASIVATDSELRETPILVVAVVSLYTVFVAGRHLEP